LLEYDVVATKAIAIETTPRLTIETATNIRRGVYCGKLRPLNGHCLRHIALDVIHLAGKSIK
jgi:hypothetical protein